MKYATILSTLALTTAVAWVALGGPLRLPGGTPGGPVPLRLRTVDVAPGRLALSGPEREALAAVMDGHGARVSRAEIFLERLTGPGSGPYPGDRARFALELQLADGARLASRPRTTSRKELPAAVAACVSRCLGAYDEQRGKGRDLRSLSNI